MKPDEETVSKVGPIWRELYGGLWHTTHPERFLGILECGAILPEPNIPDSDRWFTLEGRKNYPYARFIGGVSLFDFHQFDPQKYDAEFPHGSFWSFVPYHRVWRGTVWIEIDREQASPHFVSGPDLLTRWKTGGDLGHNFMPILEAAHVGPIPLTAFKKCLFIREGDEGRFHEIGVTESDRPAYEELLSGWRKVCEKPADSLLELLAKRMAPDRIAEAQRLAREWEPKKEGK